MYKNVIALLSLLAVSSPVNSAPLFPRLSGRDAPGSGFVKQNGLDAQKQNAQFATMKSSDSCQTGSTACVEGGFAQCLNGKWEIQQCAGNLSCYALPLVNSPGVSLTCDTLEDTAARISNAVNGTSADVTALAPSDSGSTPTPSPSPSTTPTDDSGDNHGDDLGSSTDPAEDDCTDDGQNDPPTSIAGNDDECADDSEDTPASTPTPASIPAVSTVGNQAAPPSSSAVSSASQQPPAPTTSSSSSGYQYGRRQAYDLVPASLSASTSSGLFTTPVTLSTPSASPSASSIAAIGSNNTANPATVEPSNIPVTLVSQYSGSIASPTSAPVAGGATITVTVVSTSISTVTVGSGSVSSSIRTTSKASPTPFVSTVVGDPGVGVISFGFTTVSAAQPSITGSSLVYAASSGASTTTTSGIASPSATTVSASASSSFNIFGFPAPSSATTSGVASASSPAPTTLPTTAAFTGLTGSYLDALTATL